MSRQISRKCDFCHQPVEVPACKIYLTPVLPGNGTVFFMSAYSHWADVCNNCMNEKLLPNMNKRKARSPNGTRASAKTKTTAKKRK